MEPFGGKLGHSVIIGLRIPAILLVTAGFGTLSALSSLWDSESGFPHRCSRTWARVVLRLSGVRLNVDGLEHLEENGKYVLCANHQSYMDIPVLLAAFPFRFHFTAKRELFGIPFLGWHLESAGHFPVDRENPVAAMRTLGRSIDQIREGVPVLFFPEGGTSRDGTIGRFKSGAFRIGQRSGAAIVPVTIKGTRTVLEPGSKYVHGGRVEVTIHRPVPSITMPPDKVARRIREIIERRFLGDG